MLSADRFHNTVVCSHKAGAKATAENIMRLAAVLKLLEEQLANKREQFAHLEQEHQRLQLEHTLLVGCCDGLQLLRLHHADEEAAQHSAAIVAAGPQPFTQEELQLLQQLANTPYGIPYSNSPAADGCGISSCMRPTNISSSAEQAEQQQLPGNHAAGPAAADPTSEQLSPPDDPMRYFRYLTSVPVAKIPPQLTAADLAADYAKTVHEVALQLHLLQQPVSAVNSRPESHLQKLQRVIDRYVRLQCNYHLVGSYDRQGRSAGTGAAVS